MFLANTLLYPCALAVLCLGAGLLADRAGGRMLPAPLLLSVGAASLIAISQLSTYVAFLAPATPYLMAAVAAAGLWLARPRLMALVARGRAQRWGVAGPPIVYLLALAPVLLAGRATFSSFMALGDSAVHLIGADYLIEHGQSYGHLDLGNSYGQFINDYYNTSYPSGADTLFGGSARLLGLPLIWAFQPFIAFMLATAYGPAWLLARRIGLRGAWAGLAALCAVLPALVYGYQLIGSIKEITALSMLLSAGCLVGARPGWLRGGPGASVPLALVLAGGISALGVAFGVWTLAVIAVLACLLVREVATRAVTVGGALALSAVGAVTGTLAALPTWTNLSGSLRVATNIASTSNPGNLRAPLHAIEVFGIWLDGSYKLAPTGGALSLTHGLIVLGALAALVGAGWLIRARALALAGWFTLVLLAWLVVSQSVTTWANAKTLMLTSPIVVLLAWAGVAAVRDHPWRAVRSLAAPVGLLLLAGTLLSDAMQYQSSDLAPTARYREMASLDARFGGRGPALVTDFDEYAMYELRHLDVGGPNFVYPPPALAAAAGGYGSPVALDRVAPAALLGYPLIITRRDPSASRPPAAYRLLWRGSYYETWGREPHATPALLHSVLTGGVRSQCAEIGALAAGRTGTLVGAPTPEVVALPLAAAARPRGWGRQRAGLVMRRAGRLALSFDLPARGEWQLWVRGQIMPAVGVSIDGRLVESIAGQLSGNSLVPDTVPPVRLVLAAGPHTLSVTRPAVTLAPGDKGSAVLDSIFLTRGGAERPQLAIAPATAWRTLCARRYQWVELLGG